MSKPINNMIQHHAIMQEMLLLSWQNNIKQNNIIRTKHESNSRQYNGVYCALLLYVFANTASVVTATVLFVLDNTLLHQQTSHRLLELLQLGLPARVDRHCRLQHAVQPVHLLL